MSYDIEANEIVEMNHCKYRMIDIYGWTGSTAIIVAYSMNVLINDNNNNKQLHNRLLMDILNIYGSSSIGIICYLKKAHQAVFLELLWFIASVYSLINNIN